jgi:hypothetical protein
MYTDGVVFSFVTHISFVGGLAYPGTLDVFCVFEGVFDFEARLLLDTQFASEPDV